MRVFKDLMWFFKQEKKSYLIGISLLCVVALLELVPPFVIGKVVDLIVEGQLTTEVLINWLGLLLIVATTVYIIRFFWRIMLFGASVRLARLLREKLYSHFTKMSQSFYQRRRIGDLMAHSTNDIQAIQQTAGAGVLTLVDSLVTGGFFFK